MEKECICLNCLYGSQPMGYFPIICVQGKRIKEMWEEKYRCKYFEPCPEPEPEPPQTPWQAIICNNKQ